MRLSIFDILINSPLANGLGKVFDSFRIFLDYFYYCFHSYENRNHHIYS
nr:MAG TPA: hypothetical protein [Caudoviricetes sp.]DAX86648.1 MAG TPA: hypothetical protein [Caudoviricetes sp.]